jgi:DNA primase
LPVPPEVIDEIRGRVDIVRIIGEAVQLKKSGRNYLGLCPFHQEKTPSFTVSEPKQLYHCFGCGEGGTVITFVMKHHRLTFPEALERLAPLAGIDLAEYRQESREIAARKELRRKLFTVLDYARDAYHRCFLESEAGAPARAYAKTRGFSLEDAKVLRLGYAPSGWQTLTNAMIRDDVPLEDALRAGLIAKRPREEGFYDLFRERLLFPIEDPKGNPVGFGGRVLGEGTPKYLNSPQTAVFDKGRLLYGLPAAEEAIRKEKRAVVVEGYMDQAALRFAGVGHAVATLGTALTEDHAKLLTKYTDEVVLVFDGDAAGLKAARRSLRPLLSQGLRAKVALLPQGTDPDTFVRKEGTKAFLDLVEGARPLLEFYCARFFVDERDVSSKAEAVRELTELVRATENAFLREALVDETARRTGLSKEVLRGEERPRAFAPVPPGPAAAPRPAPERVPSEELALLRLAVEVPEVRGKLLGGDLFALFSDGAFAGAARSWLEGMGERRYSEAETAGLIDAWEDETTRPLLARAFVDSETSMAAVWEQVWNDCVHKLRLRAIRKLRDDVAREQGSGNEAGVMALLKQLDELKRVDEGR